MVEVAHRFVDAGAAAFFSSHPHTIQGLETYRNKSIIYYGLGNFVYDQMFRVDTSTGLIVDLTIRGGGSSFFALHGIEIEDSVHLGPDQGSNPEDLSLDHRPGRSRILPTGWVLPITIALVQHL